MVPSKLRYTGLCQSQPAWAVSFNLSSSFGPQCGGGTSPCGNAVLQLCQKWVWQERWPAGRADGSEGVPGLSLGVWPFPGSRCFLPFTGPARQCQQGFRPLWIFITAGDSFSFGPIFGRVAVQNRAAHLHGWQQFQTDSREPYESFVRFIV